MIIPTYAELWRQLEQCRQTVTEAMTRQEKQHAERMGHNK